jgi:N-acetyl-anhydromuramyl-L-alanine amidase AmpD
MPLVVPIRVSTHFFVDATEIIQSVPLANIAYGCLYNGNHRSVQFELCGVSNHLSDATLRRAAPYVRRICDRFGIPLRKVSPAEIRNGVKGICGHADITAAFPQDHGTHTDPGANFPWATFIGYVTGGTATTQGDDVGTIDDPLQAAELSNAEHYLQSIVGLTDTVEGGITDTVQVHKLPSAFSKAFKQMSADIAELKARPPVAVDAVAVGKALAANPDFVAAVTGASGARVDELLAKLAEATKAAADLLGA